jgi:hypothetical protein
MLCDPHDATWSEILDLLTAFGAVFATTVIIELTVSALRRRRPDIGFWVAIGMIVGWLFHPTIGVLVEWRHSVAGITVLPIILVAGVLLLAIYSWAASPLLIGLGVWARQAHGMGRVAILVAIFCVGLATSWWSLNDWTNTC